MSKKIYDYEKCFELARQCSCTSEMQKQFGSAYNDARKNGWINDYTWFVRKQHKPYTYEDCYNIARNYKCSSDFQKGNGSAYGKARANGWIKDYDWFIVKQHSPFTYEECFEFAKKYDSRLSMFRGNVGAYQAALNHGWLDDYTWFQSPQKPYNYWTKARCAEESKKYGTAYGKARTNGWLDEFTWLRDERLDFHNDKIDCVYAYEFIELKSVYIGRTLMRRARTRDKEHLFVDNDAVYLFAKENNIRVPSMKILENGLTLKEGKKKEGYYVEKYRNEGWTILNRTKTGSLGNIFVVKWTKKTCHNEAMKYKTRGDFAKFNGSAYDVARRNGWLNDYTWFEEMQKPSGYWEDYDNCYNAAKECKTKTEFIKKYGAAWAQSRKRGWQNYYVWFNEVEKIAWNKKWDYDTVLEEAKKYKTRKEFGTKAHGAYKVAVK